MDHGDEEASLLPGNRSSTADLVAADAPDMNGSGNATSRDGNAGTGVAARWRAAAARVIKTKRFGEAIDAAIERFTPGAAPGVDLRRSKYSHLAEKWCLPVKITVVDYDARDVTLHPPFTRPSQLEDLLERPRDAAVRWIHVDGLNWDVIEVLALKYDLHPLALEDTVHVPQRVKADFYDSCLYVSLIYLYLAQGTGAVATHSRSNRYSQDQDPNPNQHNDHGYGSSNNGHPSAGPATAPDCSAPTSAVASPSRPAQLARTISGVRRAAAVEHAASAAWRAGQFEDQESGGAGGPNACGRGVQSLTGGGLLGHTAYDHGSSWAPARRALSQSLPEAPPLPHRPKGLSNDGAGGGAGPSHYPLSLRRGFIPLHGGGPPGRPPPDGPTAAATIKRCFSFFGRRGGPHAQAAQLRAGLHSGGGEGGPRSSIHVSAQQVSLFLLRGDHLNTLITVFQSDGAAVVEPLLQQLKEPRTLVREAEDASFLANLVIDTLVDHIFPVVGAYREQLQQYEAELDLLRPGPGARRLPSPAAIGELHGMQRDLRRLDRTIAPLQVVVSNMVSRDNTGRGADTPGGPLAAATPHGRSSRGTSTTVSRTASATAAAVVTVATAGTAAPSGPFFPPPPAPFLSPLCRTYLGDVRDHVATLCEDLVSLSAEAGDLIGLIFNLTALRQSQSSQTLTVVSTIFLPITFLAGVYGMNFDFLPELHWSYGYLYFWATSAVIVVVFILAMVRLGMMS